LASFSLNLSEMLAPFWAGFFVLGAASNHIGTLFSVPGWASSLGDLIFALRYKSAYTDIRAKDPCRLAGRCKRFQVEAARHKIYLRKIG
jgi:hypothetical protein